MAQAEETFAVGLPGPDESLFGPGNDQWSLASIGCWRGHWYPRIRGYRDAAELIEREVAESGRSQDGLIYPFLASWRQHIELALKALILEIEVLEDVVPTPRHTHNLRSLWNECRRRLVARYSDMELYDHAERLIGQLHNLDPRSDEFRYPFRTSGEAALGSVDSLYFDKVGSALRPLSDFFDIASTMVQVDQDAKDEVLLAQALRELG
jgi:hypothetical protein